MAYPVTLPKGILVFPKITEVDEYKGKRSYKTRIKFDDEAHRKVDAWLKSEVKKLGYPADAKLPWKKDKKTGELTLYVSSGEKYPPGLVDAKGNEIPRSKVRVSGGTVAKVAVTKPKFYDVQGGVISLYMPSTGGAIQILELAQRGGKFEEEQGFTYDGGDDDGSDEGSDTSAPEKPTDLDDDIPF
jgi:hypothetical protein